MTSNQNCKKYEDVLELLREQYPLGMELEPVTVEVTQERINTFADCVQDFNKIHHDEEFASSSFFGGIIAHGMLSAGFISAIFGKIDGAVYLGQTLDFVAPVRPGDTVIAYAQVMKYHPHKSGVVIFSTSCRRNGNLVITGEAKIWFPDLLTSGRGDAK